MNDGCMPIQTLYKRSNIYAVFMHDVKYSNVAIFCQWGGECFLNTVFILFYFIFFWRGVGGGGVGSGVSLLSGIF